LHAYPPWQVFIIDDGEGLSAVECSLRSPACVVELQQLTFHAEPRERFLCGEFWARHPLATCAKPRFCVPSRGLFELCAAAERARPALCFLENASDATRNLRSGQHAIQRLQPFAHVASTKQLSRTRAIATAHATQHERDEIIDGLLRLRSCSLSLLDGASGVGINQRRERTHTVAIASCRQDICQRQ
jgi:hypothetical protein